LTKSHDFFADFSAFAQAFAPVLRCIAVHHILVESHLIHLEKTMRTLFAKTMSAAAALVAIAMSQQSYGAEAGNFVYQQPSASTCGFFETSNEMQLGGTLTSEENSNNVDILYLALFVVSSFPVNNSAQFVIAFDTSTNQFSAVVPGIVATNFTGTYTGTIGLASFNPSLFIPSGFTFDITLSCGSTLSGGTLNVGG
jgi:hypothetical protein